MKPTYEEIQNLLAMRRVQSAGEDYWDHFIRDFHRRQQTSRAHGSRMADRFSRWLNNVETFIPGRLAYGIGFAYACATLALLLIPRNGTEESSRPATPVNYRIMPAPGEAMTPPETVRPEPQTELNMPFKGF